jgi:hypothetical protein
MPVSFFYPVPPAFAPVFALAEALAVAEYLARAGEDRDAPAPAPAEGGKNRE